MKETKRKIALVTGAGSGIGKVSALSLLADGFSVVLAGRRPEPLEETAREAGLPDERTLVVPTDISDEKSVLDLFARIKQVYGRLDVLFNNAGRGAPKAKLEELSLEQWQGVVDINLTGTFLCTREAFKIMKDQNPQGGRIINNGSVSSMTPRLNSAPYTATKHAVLGLTKSTALDGRAYNIACGQIDVGNARTPLAERMERGVPQANGEILVEPLMDVQHVADAVLYMAKLPLDVNILSLTVMATKMPFVGRG